jgi:hypothetical protein
VADQPLRFEPGQLRIDLAVTGVPEEGDPLLQGAREVQAGGRLAREQAEQRMTQNGDGHDHPLCHS